MEIAYRMTTSVFRETPSEDKSGRLIASKGEAPERVGSRADDRHYEEIRDLGFETHWIGD
jgi:hypothetical protein